MINLLKYTSESVSYPQITAFHNVIIFTECLEYNRVNNKIIVNNKNAVKLQILKHWYLNEDGYVNVIWKSWPLSFDVFYPTYWTLVYLHVFFTPVSHQVRDNEAWLIMYITMTLHFKIIIYAGKLNFSMPKFVLVRTCSGIPGTSQNQLFQTSKYACSINKNEEHINQVWRKKS